MTIKFDSYNFSANLNDRVEEWNLFSQLKTSVNDESANPAVTDLSPLDKSLTNGDLQKRADNLAKIFSGGGLRSFDQIRPFLDNLSAEDLTKLQTIYKQSTGRDLRMDANLYLPLEDKIRAFQILASERIHKQTEPLPMDAPGTGIKMDPPTSEVLAGSQVKYILNLPNEIGGGQRISHLLKSENAHIEEDGASFTGDYSAAENDKNYRVAFQVKYDNQLPEFYTYSFTVRSAETKAANELGKLVGTAPDSEVYLKYLDLQIADTKQAVLELEAREKELTDRISTRLPDNATEQERTARHQEIIEIDQVRNGIKEYKNRLPALETARTNVADALGGGENGKPIPLKAILIAKENGQTIPLQLYAKNLGGRKWAIVDVTNPSNPRTWTGEGVLPADALNQAWKNFVGGTNDLPAGQIAAVHPPGLGFQENANWNAPSSGRSSLKAWSNGLGAGSFALLFAAGVAAVATEGLAVPLLLGSGVLGGASAGTNAAARISNGIFKLKSTETALNMLGIIGGIASLGGLGAMTTAGRTLLANGAKFTVQNLGSITRIVQVADAGLNAAGGILIVNQYVEAIDKVNRSLMFDEQKDQATRQILCMRSFCRYNYINF